jgi:acyl dehydratase
MSPIPSSNTRGTRRSDHIAAPERHCRRNVVLAIQEGRMDSNERYLEDFAPGQRYGNADRYRLDTASAKAFAAEFDPQPFHLDERAAVY